MATHHHYQLRWLHDDMRDRTTLPFLDDRPTGPACGEGTTPCPGLLPLHSIFSPSLYTNVPPLNYEREALGPF